MWLPVLRGLLDRRMLINYRVDPDYMQKCLPAPFRPKIVNGYGVAGICLIRMNHIGPRALPVALVGSSENGALRFAVEWEQEGKSYQGVYIPARYTTSRLAAFAGTRFFPGRHYLAKFDVEESLDTFHIRLDSPHLQMDLSARVAEKFGSSAVFSSIDDASAFFRNGANGFSEALRPGKFDGVEMRIFDWQVLPLGVEKLKCDYFENTQRFPAGMAEFDHALLMRGLSNEFHPVRSFCCMVPTEQQPQPVPASAVREAQA
jgi:hypothetical protein